MPQKPYLHPSQRTLRTQQIGASSHKNSYHIGVLDGNWCEEQSNVLFPRKDEKTFHGTTEVMACFKKPTNPDEVRGESVPLQETQRELLFSHGADTHSRHLSTTNEVLDCRNNIRVEHSYNANAQSTRRVLTAVKQQEWAESDVFDQQYVTTKNATLDTTAAAVQRDPKVLGSKEYARSGAFVRSLGAQQSHLRT
eukprot:PhM_4_TR18988/c0_g1_i1/m.19583